jgi:hypothetical protein
MKKTFSENDERDRKYAWDIFSLHSSQRIATFNFYITLALAIILATTTVIQPSINVPIIALILSLIIIIISFVFYKLDARNKMLIKNAELALKEIEIRIETSAQEKNESVSLFYQDDQAVTQSRSKKSILFWKNYYSYSDCFNLVFWVFGFFGIIGIMISIILLSI